MDPPQRDENARAVAAARLRLLHHAAMYAGVTAGLAVVNYLTWGGYQWWLPPASGWGIGLLCLTVFAGVYLLVLRPFWKGWDLGGPIGMRLGGALECEESEQDVRGPVQTVDVSNVSGPVLVRGWDQDYAHVRYVKEARTQEDLADFRIEVGTQGSALVVKPIYDPGPCNRFGSLEFEIAVPRTIRSLSVASISGSITVSGLPGEVAKQLSTVSGAIESDGPGDLSARSTSGRVRFEGSSGDVLHVSSVSGAVRGSVDAFGPGGSAEISSVSGAVRLELFPELDASLELRSVSGSVSSDFPVSIREQGRGRLLGTVGEGRVPVSVRTTSGSIAIQKR